MIGALSMTPVVSVVGMAVASAVIEKGLNRFGYGDLVPMVNLITWVAAGYITLKFYMGQVTVIGGMF
ncbi:hypothetical protein SAMN05444487_1188 [Marininema mesophilum]|uniref:Uncharacterized protein n=1 Tax=Marininema mesophilum TaxID=1048340 RepID=A0A1H3BS82_9BACL|nr:hypothetical protein [Marininema mesophilum]SDX44551.1 hypothetical protein SAMN05444487_1188 [Marininema mesophilum]